MNVLFTGGSGLLGTSVRKLRPGWVYPLHAELDVTQSGEWNDYRFSFHNYETIVHAAAVNDTTKSLDQASVVMANILGTSNVVVNAIHAGTRLVYVSTDYVFRGEIGLYGEDDALHPATSYGWSKLGGECAVRMYDKGLIVRGSFGVSPFPHKSAYFNQWTSRLPVDEYARRLVAIIESDAVGVVHIAGPRRTVHQFACDTGASPDKMSRLEQPFVIPYDTSLVETK